MLYMKPSAPNEESLIITATAVDVIVGHDDHQLHYDINTAAAAKSSFMLLFISRPAHRAVLCCQSL